MTTELRRALDDLTTRFPTGIIHIGITNCRRKNHSLTSPWSEHSWGNAADLHVSVGTATGKAKKLGDQIAAYMRSRPDLWSEVFWQIDLHYDHVHGTANPRRNPDNKQTPPCAGGEDDTMTPAQEKKLHDAIAAIADNVWRGNTYSDPIGGEDKYPITLLRFARRDSARAVNTTTLSPADIEAIADRVADKLAQRLEN